MTTIWSQSNFKIVSFVVGWKTPMFDSFCTIQIKYAFAHFLSFNLTMAILETRLIRSSYYN